MAIKYFKLDTTNMTAEHREDLLERISKSDGCWILTNKKFIFKLMWDAQKNDFNTLIPHANECVLTPWDTY